MARAWVQMDAQGGPQQGEGVCLGKPWSSAIWKGSHNPEPLGTY